MSIEIKFTALESADLSAFRYATPSDYPNGRYSATITKVEAQTQDSKGNLCFRFKISLAVDRPSKSSPSLLVTDLISFTNGNAFSPVGANVFADLAACIGLSRENAKSATSRLRDALAASDKPAIIAAFRNLAETASAFTGSRVAPNIEWTEDDRYANVRGSRTVPNYESARNELDPSGSFTGDDVGDSIERQPKPRRNLKAVRR
jgi:hypothetical protein